MASTTIDLRPLGAGQLFDRALRLYRRQFLTFIGIVAVSRIPILIMNILLSVIAPPPAVPSINDSPFGDNFLLNMLQSQSQPVTSSVGGVYLVSILTTLLTLMGTVALIRAATDTYLGEECTIMDAYRRMGRNWWTFWGASIIAGLVILLLLIWTFVPLIGWFTGPGMLMFYSLVVLPFIAPIIVVEGEKATNSLPRALELAQRRFWWFIGFMLLLGIFSQIIVTGPAILLGGLITAVAGDGFSPLINVVLFQSIDLLLNMLYLPIQLTCVLLIYLDIRVRSEGLDLAMKTVEGDESGKRPVDVVAQAPSGGNGYFPSRDNWSQYFFLTLAVIGIYIGLIAIGAIIGFLLAPV